MKAFLLTLLTLGGLSACGQLESARTRPANSGAINQTGSSLADAQFQSQCQAKNGVISADNSTCLARTGNSVGGAQTGAQAGSLVIDANVVNGNFLVSSGSSSVIIALNGRFVSTANARMVLNAGSGQLAFNVADNVSTATAIVYHCFDRSMSVVACSDAQIPR